MTVMMVLLPYNYDELIPLLQLVSFFGAFFVSCSCLLCFRFVALASTLLASCLVCLFYGCAVVWLCGCLLLLLFSRVDVGWAVPDLGRYPT